MNTQPEVIKENYYNLRLIDFARDHDISHNIFLSHYVLVEDPIWLVSGEQDFIDTKQPYSPRTHTRS